MNSDSENFEQLRRLLALKRHEQPPPGYFDHLSRDVIARIKAGELGDDSGRRTWLQRVWMALEARPVFAGAFGAAVCAILVSGIVNSEETAVSSPSILNPMSAHASYGDAVPTLVAVSGVQNSSLGGTTNADQIKALFNVPLEATPVIDNGVDLLQR